MYENGQTAVRNFHVTCTPLSLAGHDLITLVLTQIPSTEPMPSEKPRLQDLLHSMGGAKGRGRQAAGSDPVVVAREILALSEVLKHEIVSQQTLLLAENGTLAVRKSACYASSELERLRTAIDEQHAAAALRIEIAAAPDRAGFRTDPELLLRILIDMVNNALAAAGPEDTVQVSFARRDGRPEFAVRTRGTAGRNGSQGPGPGTHRMKLYGERYLGGTVTCVSGADTGTEFRILLPAKPSAAQNGHQPSVPQATPAAMHRVLMVEDDEPLGRLAMIFLKRLGVEAVLCRDGVEAEEIFQRSPEAFSAVITDANMPRMGGLQLGRRLLEQRPGLPVYLCTGGLDEECDRTRATAASVALSRNLTVSNLWRNPELEQHA